MATLVAREAVVLVDTIEELIDTAELLARFPTAARQGGAASSPIRARSRAMPLDFCEMRSGSTCRSSAPATSQR